MSGAAIRPVASATGSKTGGSQFAYGTSVCAIAIPPDNDVHDMHTPACTGANNAGR